MVKWLECWNGGVFVVVVLKLSRSRCATFMHGFDDGVMLVVVVDRR